jgi:glycosyltransferase involved in cell wall biosynthesis
MFRAEVVGTRAAMAAGTPVIMATVHSSRVRSPEDVAGLAALTPAIDRLIVPSRAIEAKVRAEFRGGARFAVIPNGVDLDRFALPAAPCTLRRDFGIPNDAILLGVVARLEPEKGHRILIDAMAEVVRRAPRTWLAIVGEGSLEGELRRQVEGLPAAARGQVVLTGRRGDVAAVTSDLDVAVLPSLREAQGISLLEAMARQRPVVASAVGGIPEVVTDGESGLLVPPADPVGLADALVRVARSPVLREQLGEAGYRAVVERFSIGAQVRRIQEIYDEELARAGVRAALDAAGQSGRPSSARRPRGRGALEVPPV